MQLWEEITVWNIIKVCKKNYKLRLSFSKGWPYKNFRYNVQNSNQKNVALNTEIDQGWPIGRSHRLSDRRVSLGRSRLILHWIDKIPKKNIFQSIFQKVHKKYPSVGWSRIFFGAYCSGRLLRDNHDLGVTDTLPSVYASKAMVHCICTCDTQLWHLYLWLYYRPVERKLPRNLLVDPSRRHVGHPWNRPGVSNSNCSVGHMRAYEVTREPHYDADATMAVPKLTWNRFYILFPAEGLMNYRKIDSGRLYVRINQF